MNGNCHFVFGAAVGTAVALNLNHLGIHDTEEMMTLMVMGGILGGIFPDIDNPMSHIGKLTVPVSTVIGKLGAFFGRSREHHRGILHDPFTYIVCGVLSFFYFQPMLGFIIGCFSHLFLDLFNPMGIPFLLSRRRLRLGKIQSDSKEAIIFSWVSTSIALAVGFGCFAGFA